MIDVFTQWESHMNESNVQIQLWRTSNVYIFKGTSVFALDFSVLPCLLQLYTSSNLSNYCKFWNTER